MIYAGKAAFTPASTQLGPRAWDAVVLVQYPSRERYHEATSSAVYRDGLAAFAQTYSHGMQRPWLMNLLVHQILLGVSIVDMVTGNFKLSPLIAMSRSDMSSEQAEIYDRIDDLLRLRSLNDEALVVFNLLKPGTADQQAANAAYGRKMMTRMARLGHGSMHVSNAVTIEGDASFDQAIVVYYPGASYFAEPLSSDFFLGIIGDKQLGDTQAVPTVPILSRL